MAEKELIYAFFPVAFESELFAIRNRYFENSQMWSFLDELITNLEINLKEKKNE